jgi:hypothetical protein
MIAGLDAGGRARVLRDVTDGIERFRVGDVLRIPAGAARLGTSLTRPLPR